MHQRASYLAVCVILLFAASRATTVNAQSPKVLLVRGGSGAKTLREIGCIPGVPSNAQQATDRGLENADKINAALNSQAALVDPEGLTWAVATDNLAERDYCIRIPDRQGGTFWGAGVHDRRSHEIGTARGTAFVNTSPINIIGQTTVIQNDGIMWTFGGFTIIGAHSTSNTDAGTRFTNNEMAAVGLRTSTQDVAGPGRFQAGPISFVMCQDGIWFGRDASPLWQWLSFRAVRRGYVTANQQAVNNTILKVRTVDPSLEVLFDFVGGGTLSCYAVDWNGPCTLLRIDEAPLHGRRYEISGLHGDSQVTGNATASDRPMLVDMGQAREVSVRLSGKVVLPDVLGTSPNEFENRYVRTVGREHDIEIDILGFGGDEAIAYSRKPYPNVDRTIFHTPDVGLDAAYAPPTNGLQVYVDTTDVNTITHENNAVSAIASKFGAPNHFSTTIAGDKPTLRADGIHHRPSLQIASDLLECASHSNVNQLQDFEVRAVVRPENLTGAGTNIVIGLWQNSGDERSWALDVVGDRRVRGQISTQGTQATSIPIISDEPLRNGEPALIIWRRNAATGEMTLTVNGIEELPVTALGTTHDSSTSLTLGATFPPGSSKLNTFEGDIQHVAVWNRLLNESEGEAHTSHWRKKAGVW